MVKGKNCTYFRSFYTRIKTEGNILWRDLNALFLWNSVSFQETWFLFLWNFITAFKSKDCSLWTILRNLFFDDDAPSVLSALNMDGKYNSQADDEEGTKKVFTDSCLIIS